MSRLPIRIRLTLAFTLVMAVVLAGMSFFVYARVGSTLLASIDQSLRGQTVDVAHLDRGRLDLDASAGGGIAEVLRPGGAARAASAAGCRHDPQGRRRGARASLPAPGRAA